MSTFVSARQRASTSVDMRERTSVDVRRRMSPHIDGYIRVQYMQTLCINDIYVNDIQRHYLRHQNAN